MAIDFIAKGKGDVETEDSSPLDAAARGKDIKYQKVLQGSRVGGGSLFHSVLIRMAPYPPRLVPLSRRSWVTCPHDIRQPIGTTPPTREP